MPLTSKDTQPGKAPDKAPATDKTPVASDKATSDKATKEGDALISRDKITPGVDKIHPTDTKSEAALKLNEAHAERVGTTGPDVGVDAKTDVHHEVAAKVAEARKDIVEDNEKNALRQPERDERVKENQGNNERRRVEAAGAFDTPVYATDASCQTCADFINAYRNDQPCGHAVTGKDKQARKGAEDRAEKKSDGKKADGKK